MDFKTFQKSMDLIDNWRTAEEKKSNEWPDPRDPVFQKYLEESGVVSQDLEKSLVALCSWREGQFELYPGMSAVLHVLVNLGKEDPRGYLTDERFLMSMEDDPWSDEHPKEEINFIRLLENLDLVLSRRTFDITGGATYFGEDPECYPFPEYTKTASVGKLFFFKKAVDK